MRKIVWKFLTCALAAVTLVCGLPVGATNAKEEESGYTETRVLDEVSERPESFGTTEADGMVWTDKSVILKDNDFKVTLSALGQEYIRTSTELKENRNCAADVVFILDLTGSMYRDIETSSDNSRDNRAMALVDAANKAINEILAANEKNRISIVIYGNDKLTEENMVWLPLDSYCLENKPAYYYDEKGTLADKSTDSSYAGLGRYLEYTTKRSSTDYGNSGRNSFYIKASEGLMNDSGKSSRAGSTRSYNGAGTFTQYGIYTGIEYLLEQLTGTRTDDGIYRFPYALLLTDGDANMANRNWNGGTIETSEAMSNEQIDAYTLLTAAYQKQRLNEQYSLYNGRPTECSFFTIGLSKDVDESSKLMLSPSLISSTTCISLADLDRIIKSAGTGYEKFLTTSEEKQYIYTTKKADGSGYYSYSTTDMKSLLAAFDNLSILVEQTTRELTSPISKLNQEDGIVFTDALGEGMELSGVPRMGDVAGVASEVDGKLVYTFEGYDSTVIYDEEEGMVTWKLKASELPLVQYTDLEQSTEGGYVNAEETAITLTYGVRIKLPIAYEKTYYCNKFLENRALANAVFVPAGDNPYYNIVTADDGAPKGYRSEPKTEFAAVLKTENKTNSVDTISKLRYENGIVVTEIGNNGVITFTKKIAEEISDTPSPTATLTETPTVTPTVTQEVTATVTPKIDPQSSGDSEEEPVTGDTTMTFWILIVTALAVAGTGFAVLKARRNQE